MPKNKSVTPPHRPPLCAASPVLWSLLPLILGIVAANAGIVPAIISILLAFSAIKYTPIQSTRWTVVISLFIGVCAQWFSSNPPHPIWENLPPREAIVLLEIDELFNARKPGRVSGIGKILQTDIPSDTVSGIRVSFYLETDPASNIPPSRGQLILCQAVLTYLPFLKEQDDFQDYLLSREIFTTMNRGKILHTLSLPPTIENFRLKQFRFNQAILLSGSNNVDSPGNVLASMLLGNRSLLSDERIDLYRRSGTYHLFAVSGLHVGSVALCLTGLFRFLHIANRWIPPPVLIATWYYVWLTGSSPSAVRAGIMITSLMLSRFLMRQPHLFPALAFSAWIVLLIYPDQLYNLGFQLSYAVVGAIILIGLPTSSAICNKISPMLITQTPTPWWRRWLNKLILGTVDLSCISMSAGIVSMPLIMEYFNLFTPGGVIIGILLNPISTIVIMTGCLTMCIGPVSPWLASLVARATWPLIRLIEQLLQTCIQIPGAYSEREWMWPHMGTILVVCTLITAWILQYIRQHSRDFPNSSLLLPYLIIFTGLIFASLNA